MDNDIIMFGKYKKNTYIYILENDLNYCKWILNLKDTKSTKILHFQKYLYLKKNNENIIDDEYINCIICSENTKIYKKLKCCNNSLCNLCLIKINNFNCPFCRKNIENMVDIYIREIKKYIIEKDKELIRQKSLKNMIIDDIIKIKLSLKYIVENKSLNKKTIIGILNESLENDI